MSPLQDATYLIKLLQSNATILKNLLHASGGKLKPNISKYSLLTWLFDKEGFPCVDTQLHPKIETENHNQSVAVNVKYILLQQAHKYLGHTNEWTEN